MVDSIQAVIQNGLCVSCGACTLVGGRQVTSMVESKRKGIYVPLVTDEIKSAITICPGKGYPIKALADRLFRRAPNYDLELGRWARACVARFKLESVTKNASSGGVMVGISKYLLEEGYVQGVVTTRFKYGESGPRPESFIATNYEELIDSQGSKYCPVPIFNGLKDIGQFEGRLLFIGTPCQIAALRLLQDENPVLKEKIPLTIGNFCGGYRDLRETDKIIERSGFNKELVTKFRYRGGGQPGSMLIKDSRKERKLSYPGYARMTGVTKNLRCRLCVDATAELADFSCGDAWMPKYLKSGRAWSIVLARSNKAVSVLNELEVANLITSEQVSVDDVKNSQRGNLSSKKGRQESRVKLYKLLGYAVPSFDGGYHKNKNKKKLLLELKVHITHSIFSFLEKAGLYKVFSKLIGRYPKGL